MFCSFLNLLYFEIQNGLRNEMMLGLLLSRAARAPRMRTCWRTKCVSAASLVVKIGEASCHCFTNVSVCRSFFNFFLILTTMRKQGFHTGKIQCESVVLLPFH